MPYVMNLETKQIVYHAQKLITCARKANQLNEKCGYARYTWLLIQHVPQDAHGHEKYMADINFWRMKKEIQEEEMAGN